MLSHSYEYSMIFMFILFFIIYVIANKHNYISEHYQRDKLKKWSLSSVYKFVKDVFYFVQKNRKAIIISFIFFLLIGAVFSKISGYIPERRASSPIIESLTWTELINYIPDIVIQSLHFTLMIIPVAWLANKEGWSK